MADLAEPIRNESLLLALKALVPRHLPIVASPQSAEIARLAEAPAHHWRDSDIVVAAREHRQRSRLQVAALRKQGVVVLEEPDDELAAVLDAYLVLRSRRRI